MKARSERHHEIPVWLLNHFTPDKGKRLWMGTKEANEIRQVGVKDAFVRKNANTRTDLQRRTDGTVQRIKSDPDERILAKFDSWASHAARALIDFSRRHRAGVLIPSALSLADQVEICKQIIIAQARRTRESQTRAGLAEDRSELYLKLYRKHAEHVGQPVPTDQELLEADRITGVFDILAQNTRANFASGDHQILTSKEEDFLAPLGLLVAVIDLTTAEFVIGSHGITIVDTGHGPSSWLPIAPDVAISLCDKAGHISINVYPQEFVENHNRAALSASAHVAGHSKRTIQWLLADTGLTPWGGSSFDADNS